MKAVSALFGRPASVDRDSLIDWSALIRCCVPGKPALLYAPSGVRYGYNLSREGATFQSEMELVAKMGREMRITPIEVRYGKRKLFFEDLAGCYLFTIQ